MQLSEAETFNLVKQLVQAHLQVFRKHGFEYVGEEIWGGPPRNLLHISFSNPSTKFKISLNFSHATLGHNAGFIVSINNPKGASLDVETYLLLHGFVKERLLFTYTDKVPDFKKYVETFLENLDNLFSGELKPFLSGEKWEETPIDWMGYK